MTLEVRDLAKRFGDAVAVNDVSLKLTDAEFVAMVGPSGCGKTTLLRLIAGLEQPDAGQILIDDTPVHELPPRDRNVAMVFQGESLYPHMTVAQNLGFPLVVRSHDRAQVSARVQQIAQQYGVDDLLDRDPSTLSGGQRQRVALGRAMIREPRVCLLDEPFSHLDVHLRRQLQRDLHERKREWSTTTIFVTHDLQEAEFLGDRVAVMCDGTIQQFDTVERLREQPATEFVEEFLC